MVFSLFKGDQADQAFGFGACLVCIAKGEADAFFGAGHAASAAHLVGGHPICPAETKRGCKPRTLGTRQLLYESISPCYHQRIF